jgi:hypothetical protein
VKKKTKTGKELEKKVAELYRKFGDVEKVEHDKGIVGNQIDVYVEMKTGDGSVLRIAIEAKDYTEPVGIAIVNAYAILVDKLRSSGHIDQGAIVSTSGFSKPARIAADDAGLRLLELADLVMWAEKVGPKPVQPLPGRHQEINDLLKLFTYAAFMEVDYTGGDPSAVYSAIRRTRREMGEKAWFLLGSDAAAIGFRSIQQMLYELEKKAGELYPDVAKLADDEEYKHLPKGERTEKARAVLGDAVSDEASAFIRERAVEIREAVGKLVGDLEKIESS